MRTGIDAAIKSALSVANLVADALMNPQVAVDLAQNPARVATVRDLDMQTVVTSARVVEQGGSVKLGIWL